MTCTTKTNQGTKVEDQIKQIQQSQRSGREGSPAHTPSLSCMVAEFPHSCANRGKAISTMVLGLHFQLAGQSLPGWRPHATGDKVLAREERFPNQRWDPRKSSVLSRASPHMTHWQPVTSQARLLLCHSCLVNTIPSWIEDLAGNYKKAPELKNGPEWQAMRHKSQMDDGQPSCPQF